MMSLSNTTGHAIRALTYLAECANPPMSIKTVAECSDVPQAYLAKIVKKLNDSGIIDSKRGSSGGIWLARPAKLISLLEVCEALEGEEFLAPCLLGSDARGLFDLPLLERMEQRVDLAIREVRQIGADWRISARVSGA